MICPHCHQTIQEQDEYLMSVRHEQPVRDHPLAKIGVLILLFLFLLGVFCIRANAGF